MKHLFSVLVMCLLLSACWEKPIPQADCENPQDCVNIGLAFDKKKDYVTAKVYFEKAAEQGLPDAQYDLAILYHFGQGVKIDYQKAAYWYQKSR